MMSALQLSASRQGPSYAVTIRSGHHVVLADAAADGLRGGTAMRPHELLAGAVAACVCITIDMAYAQLPPYRVDVRLDREGDVTEVDIDVFFLSAVPADLRASVLKTARDCPVCRTLSRPVRIRACAAPAGST